MQYNRPVASFVAVNNLRLYEPLHELVHEPRRHESFWGNGNEAHKTKKNPFVNSYQINKPNENSVLVPPAAGIGGQW